MNYEFGGAPPPFGHGRGNRWFGGGGRRRQCGRLPYARRPPPPPGAAGLGRAPVSRGVGAARRRGQLSRPILHAEGIPYPQHLISRSGSQVFTWRGQAPANAGRRTRVVHHRLSPKAVVGSAASTPLLRRAPFLLLLVFPLRLRPPARAFRPRIRCARRVDVPITSTTAGELSHDPPSAVPTRVEPTRAQLRRGRERTRSRRGVMTEKYRGILSKNLEVLKTPCM